MTQDEAQLKAAAHWFRKADDALASARAESTAGRYDFALNRAYYAAFYAASAVLILRGQHFVKHTGLRASVHRTLVKGGVLDTRFGQIFDRLFDARQRADYLSLATVTPDDALALISEAVDFVAQMKRLAPDASGPG